MSRLQITATPLTAFQDGKIDHSQEYQLTPMQVLQPNPEAEAAMADALSMMDPSGPYPGQPAGEWRKRVETADPKAYYQARHAEHTAELMARSADDFKDQSEEEQLGRLNEMRRRMSLPPVDWIAKPSGAAEEWEDLETVRVIPGAGTGKDIGTALLYRDAVKNVEAGRGTDGDWATIEEFAREQVKDARGKTWGGVAVSGVPDIIAFGAEMAMSGGTAAIPRSVVGKTLRAGAIKGGRMGAAKAGLGLAGRQLGKAAIRTPTKLPVFSHRIVAEVFQRRAPNVLVTADDQGDIDQMVQWSTEPMWKDIAKATGGMMVEIFSEMTGEIIGTFGRTGGKVLRLSNERLNAAFLGRMAKTKGWKRFGAIREGMGKYGGWHGVPIELLEEDISAAIRIATPGLEGEWPTLEERAGMAASFAAIPGGQAIAAGGAAATGKALGAMQEARDRKITKNTLLNEPATLNAWAQEHQEQAFRIATAEGVPSRKDMAKIEEGDTNLGAIFRSRKDRQALQTALQDLTPLAQGEPTDAVQTEAETEAPTPTTEELRRGKEKEIRQAEAETTEEAAEAAREAAEPGRKAPRPDVGEPYTVGQEVSWNDPVTGETKSGKIAEIDAESVKVGPTWVMKENLRTPETPGGAPAEPVSERSPLPVGQTTPPIAEAPVEAPGAKQPWEMTEDEAAAMGRNVAEKAIARTQHLRDVERALKEGKPVPAEVLKDYPDLARDIEALGAKKPWQMTQAEFRQASQITNFGKGAKVVDPVGDKWIHPKNRNRSEAIELARRGTVARAVQQGKEVPAEILAEFPEIAKAKKPPTGAGKIQPPKTEAAKAASRQVQPQAVKKSVAAWASLEPESPSGKKLIRKMKKDRGRPLAKMRVGFRSIVESVNDVLFLQMFVMRSQTTKARPGQYTPPQRPARIGPHIYRTRSALDPANFHEAGHGLSGFMGFHTGRGREWHKEFTDGLIALTEMQGSRASGHSAEEGLAEFIRRYIQSPETLPPQLTEPLIAEIDKINPDIMAVLRDAHRALKFFDARPHTEKRQTDINDKGKRPSPKDQMNAAAWKATQWLIGGNVSLHKMQRESWRAFGGKGADWDVTGFLGMSQWLFSKTYRAQHAHARQMLRSLEDTDADAMTMQTTRINEEMEITQILVGRDKGREGVRVNATGRGFDNILSGNKETRAKQIAELKKVFGVTEEMMEAKHGDFMYFSDKSYRTIQMEVGESDWAEFKLYAQDKAALERAEREGHAFPGELRGLTVEELAENVAQAEKGHPGWEGNLEDVRKLMDATLLVAVLSGQYTIEDGVRIASKWDTYVPLMRQVEDFPSRKTGGGVEPGAGIHRAFGSDLPFLDLDEAVGIRVRRAVQAYNSNRLNMAIYKQGMRISEDTSKEFESKVESVRIMIPLKMDMKKAATLSPKEQATIIADGMNKQTAKDLGITVKEIPEHELIEPEDINIQLDGFAVWRATKPRVVNIVGIWQDGKRVYTQVTDNLIYDTLGTPKAMHWLTQGLLGMFSKTIAPWKRIITEIHGFAPVNVAVRDVWQAFLMGKGWKSVIPFYYHGLGIIARYRGFDLDQAGVSELYTKTITATASEAHRTRVERFWLRVWEGVYIEGWWSKMSLSEKLFEVPGVLMSAFPLVKSIDIFNFVSGGTATSRHSEQLAREGAAYKARLDGYSPERAMADYQTITGLFGQRQGNPVLAGVVRMAGFLNPGLQIKWGLMTKAIHPDPLERAMLFGVKLPLIAVRAAVVSAANILMIYAIFGGDPEKVKKILRDMANTRDEHRMRSWSLFGLVRVPFDYGVVGAIESVFHNMIEEVLLDDKIDPGVKSRALLKKIAIDIPWLNDFINPFLKTGIELTKNHSYFLDRDIEPQWMLDQYGDLPEFRYWWDTPDTYKYLSEAMPKFVRLSPLQIRYLVQGVFTRQADRLVSTVESAFKGRMPYNLSNLPVVGRFYVREPKGYNSKPVATIAQMDQTYDNIKTMVSKAEEQVQPDRKKLRKLESELVRLTEAHEKAKEINDIWREVKVERNKPESERSIEKIKTLERKMTSDAEKWLEEQPEYTEIIKESRQEKFNRERIQKWGDKLSMKPPKRPGDRSEWQEKKGKAIKGMRDRGFEQDYLLQVYWEHLREEHPLIRSDGHMNYAGIRARNRKQGVFAREISSIFRSEPE